MKYILWLASLAVLATLTSCVPNRPPSIYIQAPYDVYYKEEETVEIQCVADGNPNPKYNWTRNGRPFDTSGNDNRMVKLLRSGTIVMNKPQPKDEGIFQCLAYNELGVSTSININLRMAMLDDFPYGTAVTVNVRRGHSVKLICTPPTSIPKAEIKWVLRELSTGRIEAINVDNRITQDLEGRLYITNVKEEDYQGGRAYVCLAQNYIMRKATYNHGYIIIPGGNSGTSDNVPPHYLWATPNEISGVLGEELRIKCIFGGNPTPEVHWENKTGQIPDNRRTLSLGGQELYISELKSTDRGSYTCYTTSALGKRQQRNINVVIKAKPYWLEGGEPQDIETSEGTKATYVCRAGGDPEPNIDWFINGESLKDSKHITIREGRLQKPNDNEVTIVDLRLGDAMVLQCNASNSYGYVFADFYLNVLKEKPAFIKRPIKSLKVAENTNVNLTCQTSGKPDPIITWYKEKQQITGGRYQTLPNGDLHITSIVLSDAGNFTCTASNSEGSTSDWGVMIVRRKTRIEQRPSDLEVFARTDAKFTCSGTTDFEEVNNLEVKWLKDRKLISYTDQRMTTNVQDNSLTISGTISRDSGLYTCLVTNGLDEETSSAILTVKDRPEPPTDVHTKDCNNANVSVTWTKGGFNNAPVQYFTIVFNTSMEPDNWIYAATANQSDNTILIHLRPGVTYSFRVLATNKIGESEPSKPSEHCKTDTNKPYKNPENVRGIGDTPSYLIVEWTPMPPIEQGGDNFRYVIKINRFGANAVDEIRTIPNWRQSRFEYPTNDIYTPYNVTVQAVNEHDNSAAQLTPVVVYSGESKPNDGVRVQGFEIDQVAIADKTATFYWQWDMSTNSQLNGKFRGFKLQYWVQGMKAETFREDEILEKDLQARYGTILQQAPTEFKYDLNDLLPYTYMEAQICVMNTFYVSGPSGIVSFVTSRGVLGPVENMHPSIIGSNFVELTWDKPELLHSPSNADLTNTYLLGYDVGFQTVNGLVLGKMQNMDPQITNPRVNKTVLNGLTANTKYRLHMWAKTENGRGEDSFLEITTAKAAAMEVPPFTILNVNSTFFNVTWTTIIDKRFGTVVFVEYRIEGTSDWLQSAQEISKSWIGVSKLDSGTSYEVRLAVTNGGKTAKSSTTIQKTKGFAPAFSLGSNFGWFIGFILSVLALIAIAIFVVLRAKNLPDTTDQPVHKAPPSRRKPNYDEDNGHNVSTQDIVQKSSGSLKKGYDNYTYSDKENYEKSRDYNKGYQDDDERYDDYRDGYDDRYDERRYGDDYNRYADGDDRYDDYDNRYDDNRYDSRYDDNRYDDNDDYNRRQDDYYDDRRRNEKDSDRYRTDGDRYNRYDRRDRNYERETSYDKRPPSYERQTSYDKRPPSVDEEDLTEPAKFDDDGYPIDSKPSTSQKSKSSFV